MALSDLAIKRARPSEKAVKMFDGGGLFLQIEPTGGKLWRFKYRFERKEKLLALGSYPTVSLGEARQKRMDAKKLLEEGVDPSAAKKAAKTARAFYF
jgi:hypothetical protein